ncbi:hypothetical protein D7S89_07450 [Trinickia fusca]|uniref:Uncharacterized protein n=2 Tax=Trinickia fusca TaxID=2419777 RepID=A0A494XJJ5_9BURK|nr:hypothetical protein [Trinickia fusca]RKP50895.1 hypothetical protein D7S89_07450 [Trinickia fusca]
MTLQRFGEIVSAYGADARHWPAAECAAAQAWAARHPHDAQALLDEAAALDAWLTRDAIAPPDHALVRRVLVAADPPRARRPRWWWPGAAVAGVGIGLAGGVAGALAVSLFVAAGSVVPVVPVAHEPSYLTTGFGTDFGIDTVDATDSADGSAE